MTRPVGQASWPVVGSADFSLYRTGREACPTGSFLLAVLLVLAAAVPAMAKNVALVIGNQAYSPGALKSPVADAWLVERALRDAGFATILRENASQAEMLAAETEFVNRLQPADTALVFFAGYAVAVNDENYLLGVDSGAGNFQAKAVPLSEMLGRLRGRAARGIVILDASRLYIVAAQRGLSRTAGIGNAFDEADFGNRHVGKRVLRKCVRGKPEAWSSQK